MKETTKTEHFFVYGTLAPNRRNHGVVKDIEGYWEVASVRGYLKETGWGAALGYPALVPAGDGPEVQGFLLSSSVLSEHWPRLDAFEGDEYERIQVQATTERGQEVLAYVYGIRS